MLPPRAERHQPAQPLGLAGAIGLGAVIAAWRGCFFAIACFTARWNMSSFAQLLRYGIVGLGSNAFGYVLYLGLTALGMAPKLAMSLLYMVGVLQTFIFNKSWTFRYGGQGRAAFRRHVLLYAAGYALNLLLMELLVDAMRWPHQGVMAGLVVLMAGFFFVGQKFWVFRQPSATKLGG